MKFFLNDKHLYIEHETQETKWILSVTLQYKIDVYESKLEFLVDYLSFTLRKDKESNDWKTIGKYDTECTGFEKEKYDLHQYIWSNLAK